MPDAASWTAIIAPLATMISGLGGYWLAGRNESSRDRRALAREEVARHAAIDERLEEQRRSFQRDLLLELQDELQRFARAITKIYLFDRKTITAGLGLTQMDDELNNEHFKSNIAGHRLASRVLNKDLRKAVEEYLHSANTTSLHVEIEHQDAKEALLILERSERAHYSKYRRVSEMLGEQVRAELGRSRPF